MVFVASILLLLSNSFMQKCVFLHLQGYKTRKHPQKPQKHIEMRYLILLLLTTITPALKAQVVSRFNLNFETAEYKVFADHQHAIDSVVKRLSNIPEAYTVSIIGHTDDVGDLAYNQKLSKNRARSIASYFVDKGFVSKQVVTDGKAYREPKAKGDSDRAKMKNRRVEVVIAANHHDLSAAVGAKNNFVTYLVDNASGGELNTTAGSIIRIPAGAFVDGNGNPIDGKVTIKYREFKDPIDFMTSGVSMVANDHGKFSPYNSAGMFEIDAEHRGEQAYLKQGEQIEVNMAIEKDLESLNFYKYDNNLDRWAEINQLTDKNGTDLIPADWAASQALQTNQISSGGSITFCRNQGCDGSVEAMKKGLEWTETGASLQEMYAKHLKLSEQQQQAYADLYKAGTLLVKTEDALKNSKHVYKLGKRRAKKRRLLLNVQCKAREYNEIKALKGVYWMYDLKQNEKIERHLYRVDWTEFTLHYDDVENQFSMEFSDGGSNYLFIPVTPAFVKPKIKRRGRKARAEAVFGSYTTKANAYNDMISSLKADRDSLIKLQTDLQKVVETTSKELQDLGFHDIACFHQYTTSLSNSADERSMGLLDWFVYFDENLSMMQERFVAANETPEMQSCVAEVARRKAYQDSIMLVAQVRNDNRTAVADLARRSLFIDDLGMYNADQVKRLIEPVLILANYKDEEGNEVMPVSIYLVDSNINGIIEYNGYMNFSPYKFKASTKSENAMFALDHEGNLYKVSKRGFAKVKLRGPQMRHTFELTAVEKGESKQQLQASL